MRNSFNYRLYTTGNQAPSLDPQLGEACRLYNAALQERRDADESAGISLRYDDQATQLQDIRAESACDLANFSCSPDVLRRVDKTFKAFFRRVQNGEKPGYPRFKFCATKRRRLVAWYSACIPLAPRRPACVAHPYRRRLASAGTMAQNAGCLWHAIMSLLSSFKGSDGALCRQRQSLDSAWAQKPPA